jgi:serine/threonine-protein kinase HipA
VSLDVYLHGERVGSLFRSGRGCGFSYAPELLERQLAAEEAISHSLPVRAEPYPAEATRPFVEGLLPEGERRRRLAHELAVDTADSYALIAELGRDCPGAVVFQREGEPPPTRPEPSELAWLDQEELEMALAPHGEGRFDHGNEQQMRFTLPGERHKLALIRDEENGRWAWPEPGAPSTHILKPEVPEYPQLLGLEMACTLAYREVGLPVAHTGLEEIAGQPVLVCKRFDRWGEGPAVERLHQESFSQALGRLPGAERDDVPGEDPSVADSAGLLRAVGAETDVHTLLVASFCNLTIGNNSRHGVNCSLLSTGARTMLAPLYDIAATEVYGETLPRPPMDGAPPAPFLVDLARTISECEFEFQPRLIEAVETMNRICIALGDTVGLAYEEDWYAPAMDEALQNVTARVIEFRGEMEYLRPPGHGRRG